MSLCGRRGDAARRRWLIVSITFGSLGLAACTASNPKAPAASSSSGGAANRDDAGGIPFDAGTGGGSLGASTGGSPSGGGGAGPCAAAPPKVLAMAGLQAKNLVAAGENLFLIDPSDTDPITNIRRMKDDGSDDAVVFTSPMEEDEVVSLWATTDSLYFVERDPTGSAALYRLAQTGGTRVKITADDVISEISVIGGVDAASVYVSKTTDKGEEILRITVADGTATIIADHNGLGFRDMQIFGSDIWFLANDGLDGYFKAPLDASVSSAVQVGTDVCGFEASVTSAGAYCSSALSLDRMPLTGGAFTPALDLPDGPVDVSPPDGDVVYLVPKSSPDTPGTLRKFPIAGGSPSDLACGRGIMSVPVFDDRGVYWLEANADDTKTNVYWVAK